jgi:hypothetical protein
MKSLATPLAVAVAIAALASPAAARPSHVATHGHSAAASHTAPFTPSLTVSARRFAHVADRMPAPRFECPWRRAPQVATATTSRDVAGASVAAGGALLALSGLGFAGLRRRRARRGL